MRDQLHFDSYDDSDPDPSHKKDRQEDGYLCELGPGADEFFQRYWRPGAAAKARLAERIQRTNERFSADRECSHGFLPLDHGITCDCWKGAA